ncbi:23S rRNA (cytosine(2499)-C(5))-methyltransferase [Deinococcus radiopugnans]|uniref:23S rRNA (Cytosine(2499)-C(5))-methyltransferase n=1 Tax=Deinococcus radiopugnans ATCC 19172 TaxID=585398 RepID=A0A5C4Y7T3_9DEIO|nr:23S rRNA (cytosine(2499)-C(5))-methyltransferase [Deinococcus radiopugnans]MBB6016951.1 23S rRNA (cytosine1962-C5)-methyltransferase [Deinococcus radiopugnans ATCC 19172]TNM71501.1 23S rRNA (cytosine(2499)-C(5))-methyltransferase [Deinococcus radiopugnans ATCC 19172]
MSAPAPARPRLRLRVTAAAEGYVRAGHPWVYESSVREQNRKGEAGELAVIYDRRDRFLAIGLYDPHSPLRVRVLHAGPPLTLDDAWWAAHLDAALLRREPLFGPVGGEGDTDGHRLLNGESDGFGGLVVDRYAGVLVLKVYTAAWFPHLERMLGLLSERFPDFAMVLRLSRNIQTLAAAAGLADGQVLAGDLPQNPVVFHESGLAFEADVLRGQKTGFFLDQRENRRRVEGLSKGRRVLNAFSFSGGFSLYAARGGAAGVVSLDLSPHALAGAERNFALNPALTTPHETVQADVFDWLSQTRRSFDLVVLDPPSLARRETERAGAIRAYGRLAADGIARLAPGGILLSASCSAHVSAEEFWNAVRGAATASGRKWKELATTRHAPDHHASFAEAEYLKAIYLELD